MGSYILSLLFLLFILRFTRRLEINEKDRFCWYLLIMPAATFIVLMTYLYMDIVHDLVPGIGEKPENRMKPRNRE